MKKQMVKVLLSTMLCVAMVGTTCFAADITSTTDQTITGDNTVENPIYRVVIPTDLKYAVDAFEQKGQSQIYSEDFNIINKSNVAVKVDVKVKATPKAGVTLVDSADKVSEADDSKNLFLGVEVPSTVTEDADAGAVYLATDGTTALEDMVVDGDGTYYKSDAVYQAVKDDNTVTGTAKKDEMINTTAVAGTYTKSAKVGIGTEDTVLTFALKGADYITYYDDATDIASKAQAFQKVAGTEDGTTTFRFTGTVNTRAAWAAQDISATAVFSLIGLSPNNYTSLKAKEVAIDDVDNAHCYVVETAGPSIANTTAVAALGTDATWTVDLGSGELAATGIAKVQFSKSGTLTNLNTANWSFANNTLTVKSATADAYTSFTITFNDDAGTVIEVSVARS